MPKRETHMSATAAADVLGVDKATVSRWLHAGKMHGRRTAGGHWQVPIAEVERLAAGDDAPRRIELLLRDAERLLADAELAARQGDDPKLTRLIARARRSTDRAIDQDAGVNEPLEPCGCPTQVVADEGHQAGCPEAD